jgi:hypothetical protein
MKATIKKEVTITGDHFFNIYADDKYIQCVYFKDDAKSEAGAYDEALEIAKKIESIKSLSELGEITVYETPTVEIPEDQPINTEAVNQ